MTTKFEVGDDIWWLDTRSVGKPRIRHNTVILIEYEEYYCRYKFEIGNSLDDKTLYIWSSDTIVAKTKEELIDILYPPKIGPFEFDQLVYVVKCDTNHYHNRLWIDIAFVKEQGLLTSEYYLAKDINETDINYFYKVNIKNIYKSINDAREAINEWLINDGN